MNRMNSGPDRGTERIREIKNRIQELTQNAVKKAE